jgi:hypothetical protein
MPDAGRTRGSCVQKKMHTAHASNDRAAGTTDIPCASGFNGCSALSPVSGRVSHRRPSARHAQA